MNTNLSNKIDSLLKTAEERRDKTVIKGKTASFVYVLLAVFVEMTCQIIFFSVNNPTETDRLHFLIIFS